jgi:hypothetical protein
MTAAHTFAMLSCPSRVPGSQFAIKASSCAINGSSYIHYRLIFLFSSLFLTKDGSFFCKNGLSV